MNCSIPVGSSTTRLTTSHRSASRATCATGWRRNPSPKRRRSTTNTAPPIKANPMRWILATTGKSHDELRIAESSGEYWTHSQKSNKDIRNSWSACHSSMSGAREARARQGEALDKCKPDAKRKRDSAQPQDAKRKRDSAQPQERAQPSIDEGTQRAAATRAPRWGPRRMRVKVATENP